MQKNTSVTLGQHYENFIAQKMAESRYSTASEAIRAGCRSAPRPSDVCVIVKLSAFSVCVV